MGYTKEEKAMIWLDSFSPEYPKKAAALARFRDPYKLAAEFSYTPWLKDVFGEKYAAMKESLEGGEYLHALLSSYEEKGIRCVTCFSDLYPEELRAAEDPPFILYCKGNVRLLRERRFAIVGSRVTRPQILAKTEEFAARLCERFVIVTGLADGGDSAAIAGALPSGRVISVLAYGLDHAYPASNAGLLRKVEEKGLAVSEYIPSRTPQKYLFPARNRIIAGLAEGVLVVSGGAKSGTRITAECAFNYGRDVFAFPYAIGDKTGEGCNRLIKEYAKLTDDLVDITSAFGINLSAKASEPLSAEEEKVLAFLQEGAAHVSEIAQGTGIREGALPALLVLLQMKKRIVSCGGNRWARC